MFDKIKNTVSNISKIAVEKKISEEELNGILEEFEINLLECELPFNLVEKLSQDLRNELINNTFSRNTEFNKIIKDRFTLSINNIFDQIEEIDSIIAVVMYRIKTAQNFSGRNEAVLNVLEDVVNEFTKMD